MQLGQIGVWAGQFRTGSRDEATEAIAELDDLGYAALWVPGGGAGEILDVAVDLLGASSSIVVASGILNIWMHDPTEVAERCHDLDAEFPDRFLLGLGVSHASIVESATNHRYERPYSMMVEFLDSLDAAPTPVPNDARVLAALGPRMVELSRTRSAGAHPYCVPVAHTALARAELGEGPLLAPEVKVVLDEDPVSAREIARAHLARYFAAPNYANNLLRLGYGAEDLAAGGSDALVDDLVAWGDTEAIGARITEHLAAGADHVCLQVLTADPTSFPREQWRKLSSALLD